MKKQKKHIWRAKNGKKMHRKSRKQENWYMKTVGEKVRQELEKMKKIPRSIEIPIYKFAQTIQLLLGSDLYAIILYGSYARGDYNNNSDVDIMILVDLPETEIKKIENDVYDVAFEIEINTGINISPVIKNRAQFEYWVDTLPYYRNVRDEGITINIDKEKIGYSKGFTKKNE